MSAERPEDPRTPDAPGVSPLPLPLRVLLIVLGTVFLALGLLGVLLPVLPTTPFALLAGVCYARSSQTLYRKLLGNRWLGPSIRSWNDTRSVPRRAKITGNLLVVISFSISMIWMAESPLARSLLAVTGLALLLFLRTIPTTESLGELPETAPAPDPAGDHDPDADPDTTS